MAKRRREWSYAIIIAALAGCAGNMDAPLPTAAPTGATPAGSTPPPATAGVQGGAVTPTTPTVMPGSNTGSTPVAPSVTPTMTDVPMAPVGTPDVGGAPPAGGFAHEACGKQVSYSKPCTTEPDPCGLKSGFQGDDYCILPPKEGEGIQIHWGPKDYANPGEYVMMPGQEFNNSVLAKIPDIGGTKFWSHVQISMRPGSHHWITMAGQNPNGREGFYDDPGCGTGALFGGGGVGGGQTLIYDNPPGGVPAPENEGLGRTVAPGTMCFGMHAYNFETVPRVREVWVNLYWIDEAKVTQRTGGVSGVGALGLNLPPGQKQDLMYSMRASGAGRIIQLFGHRHVYTTRFAAFIDEKLIYDSWDWMESVVFNYDSITMNPPINTEGKKDGAVSGMVPFNAGSTLKFACFLENTSDETLRFKNELKGGEMCNMWGTTVGGSFSGNFQ